MHESGSPRTGKGCLAAAAFVRAARCVHVYGVTAKPHWMGEQHRLEGGWACVRAGPPESSAVRAYIRAQAHSACEPRTHNAPRPALRAPQRERHRGGLGVEAHARVIACDCEHSVKARPGPKESSRVGTVSRNGGSLAVTNFKGRQL